MALPQTHPGPSPLIQLLKEVPRPRAGLSEQFAPREGVDVDVDRSVNRFPEASSRLVGRGGGGGGVMISGGGSRESWGGGGERATRRVGSRVIGGGGGGSGAEIRASGIIDTLVGRERESSQGQAIRSSKDSTATEKLLLRKKSQPGNQLNQLQPLQHLPEIKRPSLSTELRRRVVLGNHNSSGGLKDRERERQSGIQARAGSRSSIRSSNARKMGGKVSIVSMGHGNASARTSGKGYGTGIGQGDVTRLVKGVCHTADESIVREKVRKILREEEEEGEEAENKEKNTEEPQHTHTHTHTHTGTATRILRKHLTYQKISCKKRVLERAFASGWDSHLNEEQVGRSSGNNHYRNQNEDDSQPVPIGQSVSGSGTGSEFVGVRAVKVAGSIRSKGSSGVGSGSGMNAPAFAAVPQAGAEWVDEDDVGGGEGRDTVMMVMGDGAVRRGRRGGGLRVDRNHLPPPTMTPSQRAKLRRTQTRTPKAVASGVNRNTILSSTIPAPPPKRSLQRFDRVEDWLDHQRDHSDSDDPDQPHPYNSDLTYPNLTNLSIQTAQPLTPKPHQPLPVSLSRKNSHTPSLASPPVSLERRFNLSLKNLPYLKHNLKSAPAGAKGKRGGGGTVTISPPTGKDRSGFIRMDLGAWREVFTIIPGSGSTRGSGNGNAEQGRWTMVVVVHSRRVGEDNSNNYNDNDNINDMINGRKKEKEKEMRKVYDLSELPGKYLRVVRFASRFVGIVRRATVVVRIEGLCSNEKGQMGVGMGGMRARWEWYRAEIYADGRFVFMVVPRGGVIGSGEGKREEGGVGDRTIILRGGVVKITFLTTPSASPVSDSTVSGEVIPRFIGSNNGNAAGKAVGGMKVKRVYVEIARTLGPGEMYKQTDGGEVVWGGIVELGPGGKPDARLIAGEGEACAGFAREVDWARRLWIECRKVAERRS